MRNIVIRRSYRPMTPEQRIAADDFFENFKAGRLKMSEVIRHYVALVYQQTGSYEQAARRLDIDRRTVKAKVKEAVSFQRSADS